MDSVEENVLIDRFRPVFVRADAEWLLDEEAVIEVLVETGGDVAWLARELNDQADLCVLVWLPENGGLSQPEFRSFRAFAHGLKAVAAMLGLK